MNHDLMLNRYWDWSLDWQDMPHAPVWDAEGGFGGDGASNTPTTVGEGRCVRDGPFADLEPQYFGEMAHPHCLSRGFAPAHELNAIGAPISPNALEDLRNSANSFEEYAMEIEHRAHTFMRDGVRGDFRAYTGPYGNLAIYSFSSCCLANRYLDPVFFLHHVNLDRLWALWQASAAGNDVAYGGLKYDAADAPAATLNDILNVGDLLPNVPVSAVMDTADGLFCYQY